MGEVVHTVSQTQWRGAVGQQHGGLALRQLGDARHDGGLGVGVEAGGGLVQQQHVGAAQPDPGQCQAAQLSPSYLIRAFSQHYHMTPHAYLLNCRIQHARRLLRGRQPLAEVAHASGFADQAHLTRIFRASQGLPPSQWRRMRMAKD